MFYCKCKKPELINKFIPTVAGYCRLVRECKICKKLENPTQRRKNETSKKQKKNGKNKKYG